MEDTNYFYTNKPAYEGIIKKLFNSIYSEKYIYKLSSEDNLREDVKKFFNKSYFHEVEFIDDNDILKSSSTVFAHKNWFYYDYDIKNDSITLSLYKCNNIEFDNDNEISSMEMQLEHTIVEVKCDYLSVEQYAKQYGVTDTTVRQWIRRGKLRTAKKKGRDWVIPALADKPKRGFENVTYFIFLCQFMYCF